MKVFYKLILLITVFFTIQCKEPAPLKEKFGTGLKPTPDSLLSEISIARAPIFKEPLPKSVDLSVDMPIPGDQGEQNSCVGWSMGYAIKTYQEKIKRKWEIKSGDEIIPDRVYSPSFLYNQINGGEDEGADFLDAINILQNKGIAPLSVMPYDEEDYFSKPDDDVLDSASKYKISIAKRIDPNSINVIKSYLAGGFPLVFGAYIDEEFYEPDGPEIINEMNYDSTDNFSHAMVIVGYDDNKNAFKIMNSWGTLWRDNGFCLIDYDLFSRITNEIWVLRDSEFIEEEISKTKQANNAIPIYDGVYSDMMITDVSIGVTDPDYPDDGEMIKFTGYAYLDTSLGMNAQIVLFVYHDFGEAELDQPVFCDIEDFSTVEEDLIGYTNDINLKNFAGGRYRFTIYMPMLLFENEISRNDFLILPVLYVDDYDISEGKPFKLKLSIN